LDKKDEENYLDIEDEKQLKDKNKYWDKDLIDEENYDSKNDSDNLDNLEELDNSDDLSYENEENQESSKEIIIEGYSLKEFLYKVIELMSDKFNYLTNIEDYTDDVYKVMLEINQEQITLFEENIIYFNPYDNPISSLDKIKIISQYILKDYLGKPFQTYIPREEKEKIKKFLTLFKILYYLLKEEKNFILTRDKDNMFECFDKQEKYIKMIINLSILDINISFQKEMILSKTQTINFSNILSLERLVRKVNFHEYNFSSIYKILFHMQEKKLSSFPIMIEGKIENVISRKSLFESILKGTFYSASDSISNFLEPITKISYDSNFTELLDLFVKTRLNEIYVEKNGSIRGYIRISDAITNILVTNIYYPKEDKEIFNVHNLEIGQIISDPIKMLSPYDTIYDALDLMIRNNITLALINNNKDIRLCNVITLQDIFAKCIARGKNISVIKLNQINLKKPFLIKKESNYLNSFLNIISNERENAIILDKNIVTGYINLHTLVSHELEKLNMVNEVIDEESFFSAKLLSSKISRTPVELILLAINTDNVLPNTT
jgi:predicted transcriptional regulator